MHPPSVFLPPLRSVDSCSNNELFNALTLLHRIFIPEVRGSSIRRKEDKTAADTAQAYLLTTSRVHAEQAAIEAIRTDVFERSFSIQWLTRFISKYTKEPNEHQDNFITERAAAILAICAGETASGALTRTFIFQTNAGHLSVLIRDAPLESSDTTSVGTKTWGGSCVLSQLMTETPEVFGISPRLLSTSSSLKTLELGAGTGLTSIIHGKLLQQFFRDSQSLCDQNIDISVVATDFHPSVFSNLCFNLSENFPEQRESINAGLGSEPEVNSPLCAHFPVVRASLLDWAEIHEARSFPEKQGTDGIHSMTFDVILGTDIIYEDIHAVWVKSCIQHFLKKPSYRVWEPHDFSKVDPHSKDVYPLFHLIIPLRSTHAKESQKIETVFSIIEDVHANRRASRLQLDDALWDLAILSQEDIICDAYADEGREDVVYRYYQIGWI